MDRFLSNPCYGSEKGSIVSEDFKVVILDFANEEVSSVVHGESTWAGKSCGESANLTRFRVKCNDPVQIVVRNVEGRSLKKKKLKV